MQLSLLYYWQENLQEGFHIIIIYAKLHCKHSLCNDLLIKRGFDYYQNRCSINAKVCTVNAEGSSPLRALVSTQHMFPESCIPKSNLCSATYKVFFGLNKGNPLNRPDLFICKHTCWLLIWEDVVRSAYAWYLHYMLQWLILLWCYSKCQNGHLKRHGRGEACKKKKKANKYILFIYEKRSNLYKIGMGIK